MQNSVFRPIYYLGCKTSFTSVIKAAIDEVDPSGGRLLDLFSGTGAVGAALGLTREVTTVDVQEYSRVLCSAVLSPADLSPSSIGRITALALQSETAKHVQLCLQSLIEYECKSINAAVDGDVYALMELLGSPPLAEYDKLVFEAPPTELAEIMGEVVNRLKLAGLWQSAETTVLRYFGGVYFSFQQAAMLDALLHAAEISGERSRDTLKAAVLSTASQIVNTVGKQFAQPMQPRDKSGAVKISSIKIVKRDRSVDTLEAYQIWLGKYAKLPRTIGKLHQALRQDYLEAMAQNASSFSVVYADPPYTRDHYSRFYHVLETMCLRDNPEISRVVKNGTVRLSRGAYREVRHQSPFCIRSTAPAAFEALFKTASEHELPLVLSYSPHDNGDGTHPRVVSIDQIVDLAHRYYDRIELSNVEGVTHNKLNRSGLKLKTRDHAEILLKCFC